MNIGEGGCLLTTVYSFVCYVVHIFTGPPTHIVGGGRLVTVAGICRRRL